MASDRPVEFKKDGSVSKLRAHRGNVPVLPQDKLCPHCPARFTRSTHLNRHMRTHSTERRHRCTSCGAEFTRSDMLTRHKRSCTEPPKAQWVRKKSCIACAASKVRCDLDEPCGKCRARERECVYPTGGRLPRLRVMESEPGTSSASARASMESLAGIQLFNLDSRGAVASDDPDSSYQDSHSSTSFYDAVSSTSRAGLSDINPSFSRAYQSNMFEPLFNSLFSSSAPQGSADSLIESRRDVPAIHDVPLDFVPIGDDPLQIGSVASSRTGSSGSPSSYHTAQEEDRSCPITPGSATAQELHYYQYLYEAVHIKQTNSLHATFDLKATPGIFRSAMQACGAIHAQGDRPKLFVREILMRARTELPADYALDMSDATRRIYTLRTTTMLQTMSMFHQDEAEHRPYATLYIQLMVEMIRRTQTIEENTSWRPILLTETSLDNAWRQWARHEHLKRLVWAAYDMDTCMVMYLGYEPLFRTSEMTLCLPCEDALWKATTPEEWLHVLNEPSAFGSLQDRLLGVPFQRVWNTISSSSLISRCEPLGLLAHFTLIHAVLVFMFTSARPTADREQMVNSIQFALHNWLQGYLATPEVLAPEPGQADPPFFHNSLPFYWLGQVALMAYQEQLPPFSSLSGSAEPTGDERGEMVGNERFALVKRWLLRIRTFLKRQDTSATVFWDDLMQIRLDGAGSENREGAREETGKEGLIGFLVSE